MKPSCLDSSAWIEMFHDGPNAKTFRKGLGDLATAVIPTICLYEVCRYASLHAGPERAEQIAQTMRQGDIVSIDPEIALSAAALSLKHRLPMADALIYAAALHRGATLWTQDRDFEGLPHVRYFRKTRS